MLVIGNRIKLGIALSAVVFAALPAAASAQNKKAKPACGITVLPLAEGRTWVYQPVQSPIQAQEADKPGLVAKRKAFNPSQPNEITVKVLAVKEDGADTVIELEESVDGLSYKTELRCNKTGLQVDPSSLFYAGQPGTGMAMTMSNLQRSGTDYELRNGSFQGKTWSSGFTAQVDRGAAEGTKAKHTSGSVEVQREVRIGGREGIATASGNYMPTKIEVELFGRGRVGPNHEKAVEIPAKTVSQLWFEPGVGVVQLYNSFGHMYQLSSVDFGE